MVRRVFSNDMCMHVWAQQQQDSGRGYGSVRFECSTLYSYSGPIARFVSGASGESVVLITSRTFSITTSRHTSRAASAVRGQPVFYVPSIRSYDGMPDHARNLAYLLGEARKHVGKVKSARFDSWESRPVDIETGNCKADAADHAAEDSEPLFLSHAGAAFRRAVEYAATFGLVLDMAEPEAELAAARDAWRERWTHYSSPAAARKRAKAAEYRERARERKEAEERERRRARAAEAFRLWKAGPRSRPSAWEYDTESPEHAELAAAERAEREQRERDAAEAFRLWKAGEAPRPSQHRYELGSIERGEIETAIDREREAREAATRAAWLAGEPVSFYGRDAVGGAYVRAVAVERNAAGQIAGGTLETSQGATVPLVHAIRAFRFCKMVWARGEEWQRNGQSVRVGHFQLDRIEATGLRAGCHFLARGEIERLAADLGVADVEPSDSAVETRSAAVA